MANLAGRTTYLAEKESRGPSLQKRSKCLGGNSSKFRPSSGLLRSVRVSILHVSATVGERNAAAVYR